MIGALVGAGVPVVYLIIGVLYARSKAVEVYRAARKSNARVFTISEYIEYWTVRETRERLLALAVGWLFIILVQSIRRATDGHGLLMGPVYEHKRRAEQLAADAKHWAGVAAEEVDPEKKSMAEELARVLGEQAKEAAL